MQLDATDRTRNLADHSMGLPQLAGLYQPIEHDGLHNLHTRLPATLAAEISAASRELLGERRVVTVVRVGVANLGDAAEILDSAESFIWIDEVMRLLLAPIAKYEGVVDKFTGDGLTALFGLTAVQENDTERAVQAALEMQASLHALRERVLRIYDVDLQARVGIHKGSIAVGRTTDDDALDYVAIGDTVALATCLEQTAIPGGVLVSRAVYQSTKQAFTYQSSSIAHALPNQLADTFQPICRVERTQPRGLPGRALPMVGRAPELASLRDALEAVCHTRQPRVALLTGEAGLGKSRLVAEFRASVVDLEVSIYQGVSLAHMRSAPLWTVADLLRDILDTSEIDPVQHQQAALDTYLRQRGLAHDGIWPYLSNVLGFGQRDPQAEARLRLVDAAMLQRQTYTALRQVLLAEARNAPTVFVFEDLQWIDPASRDFLEYVFQTTQTQNDLPILLILVARDLERSIVQSLIIAASKYLDRFLDIRLPALTAVEGTALVDRLIAGPTYHATLLKQRIAQRAVGNPFYLEEIIRMLIDQGGLIGDRWPWQVTEQADELLLQIPGTLQGLVMARFDRLPEQLRRVLQTAAVIGRSFPVRLLHTLDETHSAIITSQLVELETRQFLIPEPIGLEQGYTFRHGLFQETVYQTLFFSDRQRIHECAARAIERMCFYPADEQIEVLAYHYTESANPDRAVPLLIAAADRAIRRYANEAAIHYYRQAISLMTARLEHYQEQFVPVRVGLGQALALIGHFAEARQMLREALSHIESLGDEPNARLPWHIGCLRELADVCHRDGVPDEAIAHLEVGLTLLGDEGSTHHPRLWRSLMDRLAWIRFRQGRFDDGRLLAQAALSDVDPRRAEDPITLASLHNTLGGIFWQQGKLLEAVAQVQQSLDLYQMLGYGWGMANAYANLGVLYFTQGAWPHAANSFQHAYSLQCEMGYTPAQALSLKNLGLLQMAMGDHTFARQSLESSLAISLQIEDEYGALVALIGLAHLAITESRFDDASRHIDLAASKPDVAGEDELIQIRWTLALLQAEHGDMAKGIESAKQAIQMAQEAGLLELEAECRRVLGVLHGRVGEWVEAEHELQSSAALSAQGNDMYREGLALHELGSLYKQRMHADATNCQRWRAAAHEAHARAVDLFEHLGAAYDLRAAQAALQQLQ